MNFIRLPKIESIKSYPWNETLRALRYLPKSLTLFEKIIAIGLLVLILTVSGQLWYSNWMKTTKLIPSYGGEFKEGVLGDSKDLDKNLPRLVNAGLTKYDDQNNIVGDLASNWEINDGGKTYVFHLRDDYNSTDLASQIASQNLWTDIPIGTPDEKTITFSFKQPFSPFLNVSTRPIFSYGPYQITKESKNQVELRARDDYYQGRPYIDKLTLVFYPSESELEKAAKRGDVQGYVQPTKNIALKNSEQLTLDLPKDLVLFFNLSNKDLSDIIIRKALKEGTKPSKALNLRLVTSDTPKNLEYAEKLKSRWTDAGVGVNLDIKDNITLQKTTIPKRDYDLLLYGVDYGEDPDPYPFWHSSQIGENGRNLSNFNNKPADKLLEKARQELDMQKRQEDYAQFQTILDNEVPMFVVEHQKLSYQISSDVKGVARILGTSESDRFLNVSQWYTKTKRVKI